MSKKFDNILEIENDVMRAKQLYSMGLALEQAIMNGDCAAESYHDALYLFTELLREHSVSLKENLFNCIDNLRDKKVGAINDK